VVLRPSPPLQDDAKTVSSSQVSRLALAIRSYVVYVIQQQVTSHHLPNPHRIRHSRFGVAARLRRRSTGKATGFSPYALAGFRVGAKHLWPFYCVSVSTPNGLLGETFLP
jgi:hypothetical protein